MRSLLLFLLLACLSSPALAQEAARPQDPVKCTLGLGSSPVVLGLKLGMSPSESSVAIGRTIKPKEIPSKIKIWRTNPEGLIVITEKTTREPIGEEEFSYYPSSETNVGSIYLRFWQRKLYTVLLDFDPRDFVDHPPSDAIAVAQRLAVPYDGWENNSLTCDGFYIQVVRREKSIQVELTDSLVKHEIQKLAEERIALEAHLLSVPSSNAVDQKPTLKRRQPQ